MFALVFRFPAGRYHATPWGRNVNEADVAWPPEPWRILRALIATYWRKGDRQRWSENDLAALIDVLAERPPVYRLPEAAVHAQTRHYMPIGGIKKGRQETTLVFDAFARLSPDAEIVAAWPEVNLEEHLFALAEDLAGGLAYLGRAESWVECEARSEWNGSPNCLPEGMDQGEAADRQPIRSIAACAAADYAAERDRLLAEFDERVRQKAIDKGKKEPTAKALCAARKKVFGLTLPARLLDALMLDTSDYQKRGWSRPPASREVIYFRKPIGPLPRSSRLKVSANDDPLRFTVARFVLAGRPRPRIEETLRIGELMRLAALAQFGWEKDETSGRLRPKAPPVISGRDAQNRPLKDAEHNHAFWLPEDADGDGEIDHVVVYAREGFDCDVRNKLDRITRLWIDRPSEDDEDAEASPTARKEWRLALEGFGKPEEFGEASRLLRKSLAWESVTPFLASGHLKRGGYAAEVRRLLQHRGLPDPTSIAFVRPQSSGSSDAGDDPHGKDVGVVIRGRLRRAIHFYRFRSRGRERQPDTIGTFLRLQFAEPVKGPLALGFACHFGLGLFAGTDK